MELGPEALSVDVVIFLLVTSQLLLVRFQCMTCQIACMRSELSDACVKNVLSVTSGKIKFRGFLHKNLHFKC